MEIEKFVNKDLTLSFNAEVTPTSLTFAENATEQDYENAILAIENIESSKQWWLGDWWRQIENKYGTSKTICQKYNFNINTIQGYSNVAKRFENRRRRRNLPFNHYREVCSIVLEDKEREKNIHDRFLDKAEKDGWSSKELREQIQIFLDEEKWSREEKERRQVAIDGGTILINLKTDENLKIWAEMNGYIERIDRGSEWGNPFILGKDGDRDTVCDNYSKYLDMKPSLLEKLGTLRGKVLGCWCYPERCHGDELIKRL